jgi:hypothetical protein
VRDSVDLAYNSRSAGAIRAPRRSPCRSLPDVRRHDVTPPPPVNPARLGASPPPIEAFIDAEAEACHPSIGEWLGRRRVRANVEQWLVDLLRTEEPPAERARMIDAGDGNFAIARMQFAADGNDLRFVSLEALSRTPSTAGEASRVIERVAQAFEGERPSRVRVFIHGDASSPPSGLSLHGRIRAYKRMLAAPLAAMQDRAAPDGGLAERVRAVAPPDFSFYEEYAERYRAFWQARPDLRNLVRIEPLDDLRAYHADDGLRLILVDGAAAGVIAANHDAQHGLRGWMMRERFLYDTHRGRSLGPASLWSFIRSLRCEEGDLLYGTIARENQPSMRSALALGRVDIGGFHWIDIA